MRRSSLVVAGFLGLLALLLVGSVAIGFTSSTRYVDDTGGSDTTNDCLTLATPCATIQHGIDQANAGDTVSVAAGIYLESVTVNKALTLIGAGMGNTASDTRLRTGTSGFGAITITASDVNVSYLRIQDYTGGGASEDGITINGVISNITLDHFAVTGTATAVAMEYSAGLVQNVMISNCYLHDNRSSGVDVYFPTYVDGLTIDNCDIQNNAFEGIFLYREETGDAAGTNTNIDITNSTVSNNAVIGDLGDTGNGNITAYGFNGNLTISDVNVDASGADYGIRVTGLYDNPAASGDISLTNVAITGTPVNTGLNFAWYTSFGSFSLSNVSVDVDLATGLSAGDRPRAALVMRHITNATALDLADTVLGGTRGTGTNHPYDLVASGASLDATGVTFTQTNPFAIEDVVLHALDANPFDIGAADPTGLVTWVPDNVYVTPDSGTIGRGVAAASSGDTVNVAPGTYDENDTAVNVDKSLTISGPNAGISPNTGTRGAEAVITSLGSGSPVSVFYLSGGTSDITFVGLKFDTPNAYMRDDFSDTITLRENIFTATGGSVDGMYFEDPVLTLDDNLWTNFDQQNADTVQVGGHHPFSSNLISITDNVWDSITGSGALNLNGVAGTISGNTFQDVEYYGILVASADGAQAYASENLDITNNTFDGITNPTVSPTGNQLTWGAGVRFYESDANTGPVNVNHNSFTNSYLGVSVRASDSDITNADITVSRNTIVGNTAGGILNAGAGTLDAECNWYGDSSGPSGSGPGTGDSVSANVDFNPWLINANLDYACPAFPDITVSSSSGHDFGSRNTAAGASAPFTFTVTNDGDADLSISSVTIVGTGSGNFGVDTDNCGGETLAPTESCTILVVFDPSTTGLKNATLRIASNDPDENPVDRALSGTGTSGPTTGTIKVVLDAVPNSSQDFAFSGDIGSFILDDDNNNAHPRSRTVTLSPGTYDVTQGAVSGWSLTGLSCNTGETTNISTRTATIDLAAGENVICTFTDTRRLADAKISKTAAGGYHGNNIYSSSVLASQTRNQAIARNHTRSLFVQVQNDSLATDSFTIDANLSGSSSFTVQFFNGATDITAAVLAGTYTVNNLAAGAHVTIEIRVTAAGNTPASATRNVDVFVNSNSEPSVVDSVRGHFTRA